MVSKLKKLKLICRWLEDFYNEALPRMKEYIAHGIPVKQIYVKRVTLRRAIHGLLMITDHHTVNGWVNLLLTKGIISPNPHTELSAKQKKVKPTNDTRYFVNIEAIEKLTHPHTLEKYLSPRKHSLNVSRLSKEAIPSRSHNGKHF